MSSTQLPDPALVLVTSGDGGAEADWAVQARQRVPEVVVITPDEPATGAVRVTDARPELGDGVGPGACVWTGLWLTRADRLVIVDVERHSLPDLDEVATLAEALATVQVAFLQSAPDLLAENLVGPAISLHHPHLADLQLRASLWAVRRDHLEMLPIPIGEGAEIAAILDTDSMYGVDEVKQLPSTAAAPQSPAGRQGHQAAVQLLVTLERRLPQRLPVSDDPLTIRGAPLRVDEAPPAAAVPGYFTR